MSPAFRPDTEAFVERQLAAGTFASRDELIASAVELLRQRIEALDQLRADIAKGWEGEGIPAEQAFAQLRAKYTALADAAER